MKIRMAKGVKVTTSSGNVFLDLNFGKIEADDLKRRSELMMRAERFVTESKLVHAEVARVFRAVGRTERSDLRRMMFKMAIQKFTGREPSKSNFNSRASK
jgi:predicted XRE-type DNA-binding protein